MSEAGLSRREFLKLAGLTGVIAACNILPGGAKEDLSLPEGGFIPVEPGGKLPLELNNEYGLVTIQYSSENTDKLVVRNGTKNENGVYGFILQPMLNGQTTRRRTGEILDTRIVRLTPASGVPEKGVVVYDTAGKPVAPKDQEVGRVKPGTTVEALRVVTWFYEDMWQDKSALFEVNGGQTQASSQPERFTDGWAVGVTVNELGNTDPVFMVRGFVPNNKVLVSAS